MSDTISVTSTELAGPTQGKGRIEALDVLRGVALLGILILNLPVMGLSYQLAVNPGQFGEPSTHDYWAWVIPAIFFEGTFRTLFGILFGAGVYLFLDRLERAVGEARARSLHMRRATWLMIFGLFDAYLLIWVGDILFAYGVTALILWFFRRMDLKKIALWFLVFLAISFALKIGSAVNAEQTATELARFEAALAAGETLSADDRARYQTILQSNAFQSPTAKAHAEHIAAMKGGYLSALREMALVTFLLQTLLLVGFTFWDSMLAMLLGIILFRTGYLKGDAPIRRYMFISLIGYAVAVPLRYMAVSNFTGSGFDAVTFAWGNLSYDLARIFMALGHIGLIMALFKSARLPLAHNLAAVGQMALTNYLMHSVIALVLFILCGRYADFDRAELLVILGAIWAFQLWFSPFWLRRFRYGPMEWLWRSLTYQQKQPVRR